METRSRLHHVVAFAFAAVCAAGYSASADEIELITNGSFEGGDVSKLDGNKCASFDSLPGGWTRDNKYSGWAQAGVWYPTSPGAKDGTAAAYLNGNTASVKQEVVVPQAGLYRVQFYAIARGSSFAGLELLTQIDPGTPGEVTVIPGTPINSYSAWTCLSGDVPLMAGTYTFAIFGKTSGKCAAVDCVSATPVPGSRLTESGTVEFLVSLTNTTGEAVLSLDGGNTWFVGTNGWFAADSELTVTVLPDVRAEMTFCGDYVSLQPDGTARLSVTRQKSVKVVRAHVWVGGSGCWDEIEHWRLGEAPVTALPGENDDVVLPATGTNYTVTAANAISVGSLTIGTEDESVTGTVTFVASSLATNLVAHDCFVLRKGELTHAGPWSKADVDANKHARLNFKVGGNMTVFRNASVNVSEKGYAYNQGPGATKGAGHGGAANGNGSASCYGSVRYPVTYGSGGYNDGSSTMRGGGAIYLDVAGVLTIDQTIKADGARSAAGGSIFIKAGHLQGAGGLSATSTGAAGGRIAVYLTKTDDWGAYTGSMNVNGTYTGWTGASGGGGTIYKETPSQNGHGALNGGAADSTYVKKTYLSSAVTDWETPFSSMTLGTPFEISSSGTLTVIDSLTIGKGKSSSLTSQGTVAFAPTNGGVTAISIDSAATLTARHLSCTVPGGTLRIAPASTIAISVSGSLDFVGTSAQPLVLESLTPGQQWNLALGDNVSCNVDHVDVSDSKGTAMTITAYDSHDGGNNVKWSFLERPQPGARMVWTGKENTTWLNGGNWQPVREPLETDVLVISNACAHYPELTMPFTGNALEMLPGSEITLTKTTLSVTNWVKSAGRVTGDGELRLIDGCSSAELEGSRIGTLVIDKPAGGQLSFLKGCDIATLSCRATNDLALCFEAGKTFRVAALRLNGLVVPAEGAALTNLTLCSTQPGSRWRIASGGTPDVRGALVSDSDASAGKAMYVGSLCADGGNNVDWFFGADDLSVWVGGATGAASDFRTAENWLPTAVPGPASHVVIAPESGSATVTIGAGDPVEIAGLSLGGHGGTVTFTANAKLVVSDSVDVGDSATAVFNYNAEPIEVKGDFFVRAGGTLTHSGPAETEGNRVNLKVGGNMTVEWTGLVTATGKGFSNKKGPGSGTYCSHGGLGSGVTDAGKAYGSIFEPIRWGSSAAASGYYGGAGGGAIQLDVVGTLSLWGNVLADSGTYSNHTCARRSSGGSVFIKAGTIAGTGNVSASSVAVGGDGSGGAGGRVALYQRVADNWSAWSGNVSVAPCISGNNNGGYGTIYRQVAGEKERGGTITIAGGDRTPFPMPDDGDPKKAYKDATLVVNFSAAGNGVGVPINTSGFDPAKTEVRVGELDLHSPYSYLTLNGAKVRVVSRAHKDGAGWGGAKENLIKGEGEVIWGMPGMLLMVR